MKRIQLLMLSILCFINIGWMWHTNPKADDSMQKGYDAWQSGNLTEALSFYEEALKEEPKRADALNSLGVIYEELGLSDKAEEKYLSAIKMDDTLLSAYFNLGVLYWNRGEIQKSVYYFQKRVEMGSPKDEWTIRAQKALNNIKAKEDLGRRNKITDSMDGINNKSIEDIQSADQYPIKRDLDQVEKSVVAQEKMNVDYKKMGQPENYQRKLEKNKKFEGAVKSDNSQEIKVKQSQKQESSEDSSEPQGYQQGLIPWMFSWS